MKNMLKSILIHNYMSYKIKKCTANKFIKEVHVGW